MKPARPARRQEVIKVKFYTLAISTRRCFLSRLAKCVSHLLERREFQAETRMLLDIVAKSLYSEKEVFDHLAFLLISDGVICNFQVFIRELISNASDALEKFRYLSLTGTQLTNSQRPLEISISVDNTAKTLTIQV